MHFTIAEIAEIFAFMMAFAFLESLVLTLFLILLSALLPSAWLKDGFALKAFVSVIVLAIASVGFQHFLTSGFPSPLLLMSSCILPMGLIGLLFAVIRSRPRVQHVLSGIQERLSIMLYIYVPLGFLSLLWLVTQYLL